MTVQALDHVSLPVSDLEQSVHFYGTLVGLEAAPRPAFDFPGAWFRLGPTQTLHLIQTDVQTDVRSASGGTRSHHYALRVASVKQAVAALRGAGLEPVRGPKRRPDGVWQVFYKDPDGHYLELTEPAPSV